MGLWHLIVQQHLGCLEFRLVPTHPLFLHVVQVTHAALHQSKTHEQPAVLAQGLHGRHRPPLLH